MKLLIFSIIVVILYCLWAMLRIASIADEQIEQYNNINSSKNH